MMNTTAEPQGRERTSDHGERLLNAVERIVAAPEELAALLDRLSAGEGTRREHLAERVIAHFSNHAALVGGATALPALVPGLGMATTLLVGPLVDMVVLLKLEVEMVLTLSLVYGHDIRDPRERQLAFLLAALKTCEHSSRRPVVCDAVDIAAESIWSYTPRRVAKLVATVFAMLAALQLTRGMVRALPLVGIVVGAGMNKLLTARVGHTTHAELRTRERLAARAARPVEPISA